MILVEEAKARAFIEEQNILKKLRNIDISRAESCQEALQTLHKESQNIDFSAEQKNILHTCPHHNRAITHRDVGAIKTMRQYWIQCLDCGLSLGQEKKKNAIGMETIPYDEERGRIAQIEKSGVYSLFLCTLDGAKQKLAAEIAERRDAEWKKQYNEYLKSEKWQRKRARVLMRDNYLCQGCLKERAMHVHHLTYKHLFEELFFELISLCVDCHSKCHGGKLGE